MVKPTTITTTTSTTITSSTSRQASEQSDPKYKGVRKRKWGKWVSEIRLPNSRERIWLGSYNTPEKAARAFDAALYCLRGPDAKFNFPDSPPKINNVNANTRHSLSPQEIRVLAARFANDKDPQPQIDNDFLGESSSHMVVEQCHTTPSTSSVSDGVVQVDSNINEGMDWSFLNLLDSNDMGMSDFGLFSGLESLHSGEFYPPLPAPVEDNNVDENGAEAFSHQSFLWNF
uniref:AP2/ERF domain-containing protein n=1 Tax=Fagus sylvatica TaxID=28930 RepID=A0A2N9EGU2_FAGSY